jgi:hypothetical protein
MLDGKALDEGIVAGISKVYKDLVIRVRKFKVGLEVTFLSMAKALTPTLVEDGQEEWRISARRFCSRELRSWRR